MPVRFLFALKQACRRTASESRQPMGLPLLPERPEVCDARRLITIHCRAMVYINEVKRLVLDVGSGGKAHWALGLTECGEVPGQTGKAH